MKKTTDSAALLFKPEDNSLIVFHRDQWTQEILRLLVIITIVPALVILAGRLFGYFSLREAYLVIFDLSMLILGWYGAKRGGAQWAGYIPAFVCLVLAANGLNQDETNSTMILLFALTVFLSGMLQGYRTSFFYVGLCTITFSVLTYLHIGNPTIRYYGSILGVFSSLSGVALLQWFYTSRLRGLITDQVKTDLALKTEVSLRQRAEEDKQEKETQLQRLAEYTTDLVTEIALDGTYLYLSPSYRSVLGYEPDQLMKANAFDLVYPDDMPLVYSKIEKALSSNERDQVQYRVRHALGHYVWIETFGNVVKENAGKKISLVLSSRDISKQKAVEESNTKIETRFQNIIEAIPFGIHMFTLDEKEELIFSGFNPSANSLLGIDHSSLIGKTLEQAFPRLVGTEISSYYRNSAKTGLPWYGEQVVYQDEIMSGIFSVTSFQTSPGNVAVLFEDITNKIKTDDQLRLSEEKFSAAFHTSPDSININRMSDGLYIDINEGFTKMTGYSREDVIGKTSLELNIWANPEDRTRLVQEIQQFGVVENLEASFRYKNDDVHQGLMSASEIMVNGEKCLLNITRDISERIRSEQKLREAHVELEQAYEATLQGWVETLDLREHETAEHSRHVVDLTLAIAREMNLSGDYLLHLKRGALLHDIGKIGVPDEILLKPGPLTPDEWVIMKQHPCFGFDLINKINFLKKAIDIPYCHHEKWDGSGYPRGLKGEEIPLSARIFAIADVWDALLSDRPYRPAWEKDQVKKYILNASGRHFDPELVQVFVRVIEKDANRMPVDEN